MGENDGNFLKIENRGGKQVFERHYGMNTIEYRFKCTDMDEREIHEWIIAYLQKSLETLVLTKDNPDKWL